MTQKTGRFGASGREFCLYSLEKEDIEETLQLMDRCVGENLYQKEELEQAIGSSERAFLLLRTAEGELAVFITILPMRSRLQRIPGLRNRKSNRYASRILWHLLARFSQ